MQEDTALDTLYPAHLTEVSGRWSAALATAGFDAAVVTAGEPKPYFLDDQSPPLKLNPHFLQWCPSETAAGSALLVTPGRATCLYFLRPDDYWHKPPDVPVWAQAFEVKTFADRETLLATIRSDALKAGNRVALVGDSGGDVLVDFPEEDRNPAPLLNPLHFARATKTPFELACMRAATAKAARGHRAAREAFLAGASEFQINLAYLGAAAQLPAELPYQNIVALNEHAGVLHYQHYDQSAPGRRLSFLIDAGGSHLGYAADVTRTYAAEPDSLFAELIDRLDVAQQAVVAELADGVPFLDLHTGMHRRLAAILADTGLVTATADAAFETGVTETFLPHGLGHLIGLQTHDVGGQQRAAEGGSKAPPANYPALRLTRVIGEAMPVTIEPGLYFIPQLLDALRASANAGMVDWERVTSLVPYGGIRIEDNVALVKGRIENFTRDAFARLDGV
ncbi:MAG: Xaa-Pro dipeptidase [Pseudomonadales bacterium]